MKVNVKRYIETSKFGIVLHPTIIYNAEVVDNGRWMVFVNDYIGVLVENKDIMSYG